MPDFEYQGNNMVPIHVKRGGSGDSIEIQAAIKGQVAAIIPSHWIHIVGAGPL